MNLVQQVNKITHAYAAKGGPVNRRQQVSRILAFAKFAEELGVISIGQLGKNHVVKYWKNHRELSDPTLLNHYYAICVLWRLIDKIEKPPRPRFVSDAVAPLAPIAVDLKVK